MGGRWRVIEQTLRWVLFFWITYWATKSMLQLSIAREFTELFVSLNANTGSCGDGIRNPWRVPQEHWPRLSQGEGFSWETNSGGSLSLQVQPFEAWTFSVTPTMREPDFGEDKAQHQFHTISLCLEHRHWRSSRRWTRI